MYQVQGQTGRIDAGHGGKAAQGSWGVTKEKLGKLTKVPEKECFLGRVAVRQKRPGCANQDDGSFYVVALRVGGCW